MIRGSIQDEKERIEELQNFHILDTLSEEEYENITTLASIICDAPISLISLIDTDRQWFKSHKGLPVSETPREFSFCAHALEMGDGHFIVPDSRIDERFKDNPLVTGDPKIVFYAGIPLVSKNGHALGTVCVIDNKPRELTDKQIEGLKILSGQVIALLEQNRANFELNRTSTELESKLVKNIADNALEVAKKNRALEKINRELESFTYISSHDLQEPLRKIQTFISLISDRESGNLSEKGKRYVSKIYESSTRMRALLRDLLNYSKSTDTKKEFRKVSLGSILDEVRNDLAEEIETSMAQIDLINDLEINVIPFQFRQLLYNLIANSIRFSRPGHRPKILIDVVIDSSGTLDKNDFDIESPYFKITLKDNGIGFKNEQREKIFELFRRLDYREQVPGTGIGLAIVKKIVNNHMGVILATGRLNEGSIFEIYLPMN